MGVGSVRGRPLIHKVVSRISTYMLPQTAPQVRHPPSKIPTSCKILQILVYIWYSLNPPI